MYEMENRTCSSHHQPVIICHMDHMDMITFLVFHGLISILSSTKTAPSLHFVLQLAAVHHLEPTGEDHPSDVRYAGFRFVMGEPPVLRTIYKMDVPL